MATTRSHILHLARVVLICLAAAPLAAQDTTRPADSVIRRLKAEQKPLPVDPREHRADVADDSTTRQVLVRAHDGRYGVIWSAMRRSANQAVRARLIQELAGNGITAGAIEQRLQRASDAGERAALIRALGQFPESQISPNDRQRIVATLVELYGHDPDAEVYSSIAWLHFVPSSALDSAAQTARTEGRAWNEIVMGHTLVTIRPPPRAPF